MVLTYYLSRVHINTYLENISSSVLVLGLAKVNIFQLILTELRSVIFTSLIEVGQGSVIERKSLF